MGEDLGVSDNGRQLAVQAMTEAGVHPRAISVFAYSYDKLAADDTGLLVEDELEPVADLPRLADLPIDHDSARSALAKTAVVKLNGGLGTSMGMEQAKSLLSVHDGLTFLDVIARQILALRAEYGLTLPLLFMDSFRTQTDTLAALSSYPELVVAGLPLDFRQNSEPKLRADDLTPVSWPADPSLQWCPPGHGDLYTALDASGVMAVLAEQGYEYLFVSNSDNLGARPDPRLAAWFAASGSPFAAEFCRRTAADRKGGHLARRRADGGLVLRESAQTRPEDEAAFGDIDRHRYFNTNNLWLHLPTLAATMQEHDGVLGLPIIRNLKTVDPSDPTSTPVIQIETAMGAAVGVFPGATAIEVDRARFLPVKATSDLLVLRSDAYRLTSDFRLELVPHTAPLVELGKPYKLVRDFDARFPAGPPSLARCESLTVYGDWTFGAGVEAIGVVQVGAEGSPGTIEDGAILGG